ncbi:hypothetical protein CPB84DRAFT_1775518 [Gymnopilus junonius]|uniref:Secreted protein n=1 Tax=Gymnopilus junonius TaxID=109634 RepID=A0A9P5NQF2_GYMJU|nr:hypothetical protein CPB84DRAFT_1775518 [Gymnopilus junonius]
MTMSVTNLFFPSFSLSFFSFGLPLRYGSYDANVSVSGMSIFNRFPFSSTTMEAESELIEVILCSGISVLSGFCTSYFQLFEGVVVTARRTLGSYLIILHTSGSHFDVQNFM